MPYDCDLAMQICRELGIDWDSTATCATVAGKPINTEHLTSSDIFFHGFSTPEVITESVSIALSDEMALDDDSIVSTGVKCSVKDDQIATAA